MDLAAAFLLSLLGGYCFAYQWHATALATKRADGHHLYFRAALCGSVLFVVALGMRRLLDWSFPACLRFDSALIDYFRPALKVESGLELVSQVRRVEWIVTAVYSLLLGIGCGLPADCRADFELQIRADEIVSAAKFSPAIYTEFNPDWRQRLTQPNQPRSSIGTNFKFSGPT